MHIPTPHQAEAVTAASAYASKSMSYYFAIVGTRDNPLYESNFSSSKFPSPAPLPPNVVAATSLFANGLTAPAPTVPGTGSAGLPGYGHKNSRHVMQMVAHASLDAIEDIQWSVPTMCARANGLD